MQGSDHLAGVVRLYRAVTPKWLWRTGFLDGNGHESGGVALLLPGTGGCFGPR